MMGKMKQLRLAIKNLPQLPGSSKKMLFEIAMNLRNYYVDQIEELKEELAMWDRLWCDKQEDRLWHASDRTWWYRPQRNNYSPYGADAPFEIRALVQVAREIIKADQSPSVLIQAMPRLKKILKLFEIGDWESRDPYRRELNSEEEKVINSQVLCVGPTSGGKARVFFLGDQHTTHVTRAQNRKERREFLKREASKAKKERLAKRATKN